MANQMRLCGCLNDAQLARTVAKTRGFCGPSLPPQQTGEVKEVHYVTGEWVAERAWESRVQEESRTIAQHELSTGILVRRHNPLFLTDDAPGILFLAPHTRSPCDLKYFPYCLVCDSVLGSPLPYREPLLIEKWVEGFKRLLWSFKE